LAAKSMKQIAPRIDEVTRAFLERSGRSVGGGAEYVLAACARLSSLPVPNAFADQAQGLEYAVEAFSVLYRKALVDLRGKFSAAELSLMISVSESLRLAPQMAGQQLRQTVFDGIVLDGVDRNWKVDGTALNKKLSDLELTQTAALEIWSRSFWESGASRGKDAMKEYVAPLAAD